VVELPVVEEPGLLVEPEELGAVEDEPLEEALPVGEAVALRSWN